jgi:membrane associated rhomboid family serine protease
MLMFVLFGVDPNSDILAHFGGFIGGLIFGAILALAPTKLVRSRAADHVAFFFFVTISVVVWILALR